MAHQIEIKLGVFAGDEHHKVRNFVEGAWLELSNRGWVEMENFDGRINPGAKFHFAFPARASHEATVLVQVLVRKHRVDRLVMVTHTKKAQVDG